MSKSSKIRGKKAGARKPKISVKREIRKASRRPSTSRGPASSAVSASVATTLTNFFDVFTPGNPNYRDIGYLMS